MDIPERVRLARRKAGLTQATMAQQMGISRGAVANWESSGQIRPSTENLQKFAALTGTTLDWVLSGRGPMLMEEQAAPASTIASPSGTIRDSAELNVLTVFRAVPTERRAHFMEAMTAMLVVVCG